MEKIYKKNFIGLLIAAICLLLLTTGYAQNSYTIAVHVNPLYGGAVSGGGTFSQGQTCTVSATPAIGFHFLRWTEDGTTASVSQNYTFTVTGNRDLVAQFEINTYVIAVSTSPSNGGAVTGGGIFNHGQSCTVTATPAEGYHFLRWKENGTQVSTDASYNFTVTGNRNLVAQFQLNSYDISVSANPTNGGTVSGGGTYYHFATCTVTAVPANGYHFYRWTENGQEVSTDASYTFNVTANRNLVANFQINSYTISVSGNPANGGSVNGGGSFNHFETCTVTATPATGYHFVNWTENGNQASTNASYTFTVTGNRNLVANFELIDYTISVSANPSQGGSATGGGTTFHYGNSCTVTATPAEGYHFLRWTENDEEVSREPNYTFIVTEYRSLVANFQQKGYTIDVVADPVVGGIVIGGGQFFAGSFITIHAIATDGYKFINWTMDNVVVSISPDYSFQVTGNATYVAHFEAIQQCAITVLAEPTDGGQVTGGGDFPLGVTCNLKATPNSGYKFDYWKKGSGIVGTEQDYSFIVTGDATYTAYFSEEELPDNLYKITVLADPMEGGEVSGGGHYVVDTVVTLTAEANENYRFIHWTKIDDDEFNYSNPEMSIHVIGNATYVAHFEKTCFDINVEANPANGGRVSGGGQYPEYTLIELVAFANTGYRFKNWMENGEIQSLEASYIFEVTGNRNLIAVFEELPTFTITAMAGNHGTITPEGDVTVYKNADQTFTMTPEAGGRITNVLVDGIDIGPVESYTFRNVSRDHIIYGSFSGVGVEETQMTEVEIYPNPAKDKVHIEGEGIEKVALCDLLGNVLMDVDYGKGKELNVSKLSSGTYVLVLATKNGNKKHTKLVVTK